VRVPLGVLLLALALASGCEDIRRFNGSWAGEISPDPVHQLGFGPTAILRANLTAVSRTGVEMTIDLPERGGALPFEPIRRAAGDALGELRLDGEPLRTYLGYVRVPGQESYLAVVSLFPEDRIDVRIIRGPDETYAIFSLRRATSLGDAGAATD
jgi:hypothetical protein